MTHPTVQAAFANKVTAEPLDYTNVKVSEHLKTAAVSMNQVSRLLDPEAHEVYGKLLPVIRELQYAAENAGDQKLGHLFGQAVTYMTGKLR